VTVDVRGPAGRIARLLLAWKAATLINPTLSRTKALRIVCLERIDGIVFLPMAGKLVGTLVETIRFDAAARHVCRSNVGRTIDAISDFYQSFGGIEVNISEGVDRNMEW
jgi:hypothetical protein